MATAHSLWRPRPVLLPAALIYEGCVRLRNLLYDWGALRQERAGLPVISVGNIVAGGSGKTPFTRTLALELLRRGHHPVILSRGYGGSVAGPALVTTDSPVDEVGDEALMQARALSGTVSVVICRKRAAGARFIAERQLGDVILLDDGFQHRALGRDVDLVLFDCSTTAYRQRWLHGRQLPAGWLREPLGPAVRRASAAVLVHRGAIPFIPAPAELSCPAFHFRLTTGPFRDARSGVERPSAILQARDLVAVTAIANPESFFEALAEHEIQTRSNIAYADHATFSQNDVKHWWSTPQSTLVCTEKDVEKLLQVAPEETDIVFLELRGELSEIDTLMRRIATKLTTQSNGVESP